MQTPSKLKSLCTPIYSIATLTFACLLGSSCSSTQSSKKPIQRAQKRVASIEEWRAVKPNSAPLKTPEKSFEFQETVLKNKLKIYVSEEHAIPIVQVSILLRGGSADDGKFKAGLAYLTAKLLDDGAGKMNTVTLSAAFEKLGSRLHITTSQMGIQIHANFLKENLEQGLKLLSTLLLKPVFDSKDVERSRREILSKLKAQTGQTNSLGYTVLQQKMYGANHPYGTLQIGNMRTIKSLSRSKIRAYWKKIANPSNAAISFSGDITLDQARELAQKNLGKWRGRTKKNPNIKVPKLKSLNIVLVQANEQATQSTFFLGKAIGNLETAEAQSLRIAHQIFSGAFNSRLNLNLRENKGWSYGVTGRIINKKGTKELLSITAITHKNVFAAFQEILAELNRMKEKAISKEEFVFAQNFLRHKAPLKYSSLQARNTAITRVFFNDLNTQFYAQNQSALEKVTLEQVQKSAEKYYADNRWNLVIVGNVKELKKEITALKIKGVKISIVDAKNVIK